MLRDELLQLLHVSLGLGQGGLGEAHRVAGHGDAHVVSLCILQVNTERGGKVSLLFNQDLLTDLLTHLPSVYSLEQNDSRALKIFFKKSRKKVVWEKT